jgi:hypothetical protein
MLSKVGIIRACLRCFYYYKMIRFYIKKKKNGGWFWNLGPLRNLLLYFVIDIDSRSYHISRCLLVGISLRSNIYIFVVFFIFFFFFFFFSILVSTIFFFCPEIVSTILFYLFFFYFLFFISTILIMCVCARFYTNILSYARLEY